MKKYIKQLMIFFLFGLFFLGEKGVANASVSSDGEGYLWRTDWKGKVEIYGVTSLRTAIEIVIPEQIDGKDVVKIASGAFSECRNLKRVEIPAKVMELEDSPFFQSYQLEEIVVAEANPYFVSIGGCVYSTDLSRLYCVPGAYQGAFVVEPWVKDINGNALSACRQIESIYLSYDMSYAERGVSSENWLHCIFNSCSGLKEINVAKDHPNFSSVDGVLFSKNGKNLITVPPAYEKKVYIVPDTVEKLAFDCFADCVYLEKIILHNGLTEISENAFERCSALKEVVIPEGIKVVGRGAFRNCMSLKHISLPSTITRIAEEVFDGCASLATIEAHGNEAAIWQAIESGTAWSKDGEQSLPEPQEPVVSVAEPQADWLTRQRAQEGTTIVYSYQVTTENKVIITGLTQAAEKEKQMRRLIIPQKISGMQVVGIDAGAFAKVPLTEVTLPEGLLEIGKGAFYGCNLTEIRIPASVSYIAPRAFGANYGLEKINVPKDSQTYCSVNGVLYTKQMNMLCQVPANYNVDTFILPEGLLLIGEYSFGNNRHIVNIYTVGEMPEYREKAFWNMENYTEAE